MESGTEIESELALACSQLNAAHGRLVELVAEVLEAECWVGAGVHSCEQWVAWKAGLSPARAHDVVILARRRQELPAMTTALAEGLLSVDQATVVARHTPVEFEADVVAFAKLATVSQLRRTLRSYRFDAPGAEADDAADPLERTGVSSWYDDRGRYRLRAVLDADDGAIVDAALREAKDALFHAGDAQASWADALVEVASRSLGDPLPVARRELFTAHLHVALDGPDAYLHRGPALPEALRRQLLCDARGAVVGIRNGRPVDVGRSRRIVPSHTRRLVEDRDRGCRVPGCTNTRVQIHHLVHWEDGGRSDMDNLVALCHRHHRLHHRQRLGITGDPQARNGLVFTDAGGRPLAAGPPPPPTSSDQVLATARWRHPTGERLHTRWVHFNRQPRAG